MLHVREYGPRDTQLLPVVCLPGAVRIAGDFEVLATTLSRQRVHGDWKVPFDQSLTRALLTKSG
jgi:hypothetical protein